MGINLSVAFLGEAVETAPENVLSFEGFGGVLKLHPGKWRGHAYWAPQPYDELGENEASCFDRHAQLHDFLITLVYYDYSESEEGRAWTDHWRGLVKTPELVSDFMRFHDPHESYAWYPTTMLENIDYSRVDGYNEVGFPDWYFNILKQAKENNVKYIIFMY